MHYVFAGQNGLSGIRNYNENGDSSPWMIFAPCILMTPPRIMFEPSCSCRSCARCDTSVGQVQDVHRTVWATAWIKGGKPRLVMNPQDLVRLTHPNILKHEIISFRNRNLFWFQCRCFIGFFMQWSGGCVLTVRLRGWRHAGFRVWLTLCFRCGINGRSSFQRHLVSRHLFMTQVARWHSLKPCQIFILENSFSQFFGTSWWLPGLYCIDRLPFRKGTEHVQVQPDTHDLKRKSKSHFQIPGI